MRKTDNLLQKKISRFGVVGAFRYLKYTNCFSQIRMAFRFCLCYSSVALLSSCSYTEPTANSANQPIAAPSSKLALPQALPSPQDSIAKPQSERPSKSQNVKIESVTVESNNPGQVKIVVVYRFLAQCTTSSNGVRVFNAKGKQIQIKPKFNSPLRSGDASSFICILDLNSVPRSAGALTARIYVSCDNNAPAISSIPLRDANGKITAKRVVSLRLNVVGTGIDNSIKSGIVPTVTVQGIGNSKKLKEANWSHDPQPYLVDDAGNKYQLSPTDVGFGFGSKGEADVVTLRWTIERAALPKGAKKLKFKTWFSADGGPQIPVSVPLTND